MAAKKQTMERIFGLLRAGREPTRQDIALELGLSMPTTLQNVTDLLDAGILEESGAVQSNGGRKARRLRLRADAGWAIGINAALHHTELVAVDLTGEMRCSRTLPFAFRDTPEWYGALHDALAVFVQELIPAPVLGAGVSFPGTFDSPDRVSSHILGLSHMGLERFRKCIPYPAVFENDANSACRAEQRTASDSFFYLSLNETVGGAAMLGGRLLTGDTFQAGEVGHILLFPGGKRCYCGKCGCADAYLSPKALGGLDGFFARLDAGDEGAHMCWDVYLDHLAILLTNLRMLYNMDLIVGGEAGAWIPPWLPRLREMAARYDRFARDIDYIYPCAFRKHACAAGAAKLALDRFAARILYKEEETI